MPIDYTKYPANWNKIREDILDRAHNRCEFCGVENHSVGYRKIDGNFITLSEFYDSESYEYLDVSDNTKEIKIVLTIAHLDNNVNNNDYSHLKALCQQCHNRHDIKNRVKNRKENKEKSQEKIII